MEDKSLETHLGFIQAVITRMGQNSFQSKAWCLTIITALSAFLVNQDGDKNHVMCLIISIIVTVLFCLLDTYYLYLEKGYRNLYKIRAGLIEGKTVKNYDMEIPKEYRGASSYMKALKSISTGVFYGPILIGLVVLLIIY